MNIFVTSSCALTILLFSWVCSAFTINVTKFTDSFDGVCDSDCSLREAVRMANIRPDCDQLGQISNVDGNGDGVAEYDLGAIEYYR